MTSPRLVALTLLLFFAAAVTRPHRARCVAVLFSVVGQAVLEYARGAGRL